MSTLLREHAEQQFAEELHVLAETDRRPRPPNWHRSPQAVATYLLGGALDNGFTITPKYIGNPRLMEIAIATLATDRALLLLGVPGTAKPGYRSIWRRRFPAIPPPWCKAPPAPAKRPFATAGTMRDYLPKDPRQQRWSPVP